MIAETSRMWRYRGMTVTETARTVRPSLSTTEIVSPERNW